MADLPSHPDSKDDSGVRPDRGSTASRSRWVYACWTVVIGLALLFIVLHLTGAIGPGGH